MLRKLLLLISVFLCIFGFAHAQPELLLSTNPPVPVAVFPEKLIRIEDEAFSGTNFWTILFHEGLRYIGDRAFEENKRLQSVYLPESVNCIGRDAIPDNEGLLVVGKAGSFAQQWAEKQGFRFLPVGFLITQTHLRECIEARETGAYPQLNEENYLRLQKGGNFRQRSLRRRDRPEMNVPEARIP